MRMEAKLKRKKPKINRKRLGLCLFALALVFGSFAWWFKRPYQLYLREMDTVRSLQDEKQRIQDENQLLQTRAIALQSDAGRVVEARSLGYLLPGEQVIDLPGFDPNPPPPPPKPSTWDKIKNWLKR